MYSADYQSVSVRLFVTISRLYNNNNEALVVRQLLKMSSSAVHNKYSLAIHNIKDTNELV